MELTTIHPFPARMAPDLVQDALNLLPEKGKILDPMCGSGTVARSAIEAGHDCVGVDLDPLAVLMSRAWTDRKVDTDAILNDAAVIINHAKSLNECDVQRPSDTETRDFIAFWFAARQEDALARITTVLRHFDRPTKTALKVALSRIIISKEMKASLARDTSHSRPHKVAEQNDFDVFGGFEKSARILVRRLLPSRMLGRADIRLGDARTLENVDDNGFDMVITSPPYLNAIDYLRGHRMSLVWMGHLMASLRKTRSSSVGAERIMRQRPQLLDVEQFVTRDEGATIGERHFGWIRRYASDMEAVLTQIRRKLKPTGCAVLVLGNSFVRGARVRNAELIEALATQIGFAVQDRKTRNILARRRYLPPPGSGKNALDTRMRLETVLTVKPL